MLVRLRIPLKLKSLELHGRKVYPVKVLLSSYGEETIKILGTCMQHRLVGVCVAGVVLTRCYSSPNMMLSSEHLSGLQLPPYPCITETQKHHQYMYHTMLASIAESACTR